MRGTPSITEERMPDPAGKKKWALVVGISEYTKFSTLDGCVNDARLWSSLLVERFGFPPENVRVLSNRQATRKGILEGMEWLEQSAGEGDIVVFTYSGHGSRMTDREGDEPDGMDETLVPIDSGRAPSPNRDITDDEIHLWLARVGEKTPFVTIVLDCCHSGTAVRDAASKERRVEPDTRSVDELPPSPIPESARGALRGTAGPPRPERGGSGWLPLSDRYVLLAGCRDEESAYEHAGEAGVTHGALTYFLCSEISRARPGATYRDVMERAAARVTASKPRQHPQIEGAWDRILFGTEVRPPEPYLLVTERTEDRVTLSGGAAHGVTVGSEWAIADTQVARLQDAASPAGRIRITAPGVITAAAEILEERAPGAITAGQRAFETVHDHGEMRLAVQLVAGDPARRAAMETALLESTFVRLVDSTHSNPVRLCLLGPRAAVTAGDPFADEGAFPAPAWVVAGSDGHLLVRSRPDGDAAVREIVSNLESHARYRSALAVHNPDPNNRLAGKIDLVLKRKDAAGKWVPAVPDPRTGEVVYEDGDDFALEVTSLHEEPLHVSVLDFGVSGSIDVLYPPRGPSETLAPRGRFETGVRRGDEITLAFPEDMPASMREGIEVFKLFVTGAPADFRPLTLAAMRKPPDPRQKPLEALLYMATAQVVSRHARSFALSAMDWITIERPITLRRRGG